jgi:hypothetical protein
MFCLKSSYNDLRDRGGAEDGLFHLFLPGYFVEERCHKYRTHQEESGMKYYSVAFSRGGGGGCKDGSKRISERLKKYNRDWHSRKKSPPSRPPPPPPSVVKETPAY